MFYFMFYVSSFMARWQILDPSWWSHHQVYTCWVTVLYTWDIFANDTLIIKNPEGWVLSRLQPLPHVAVLICLPLLWQFLATALFWPSQFLPSHGASLLQENGGRAAASLRLDSGGFLCPEALSFSQRLSAHLPERTSHPLSKACHVELVAAAKMRNT